MKKACRCPCPACPVAGCRAQRATEAEALANIREAIVDYLAVRDELLCDADVREVEVAWFVPRLAGVNHVDAVSVLEKLGFRTARQGKHIVLTDGQRILTIPRHNPVNAFYDGWHCP